MARILAISSLVGCATYVDADPGSPLPDVDDEIANGKSDEFRRTDVTTFDCSGMRIVDGGSGQVIAVESTVRVNQQDLYDTRVLRLSGPVLHARTEQHSGLRFELKDDDWDATTRLRFVVRQANCDNCPMQWLILNVPRTTTSDSEMRQLDSFDYIAIHEQQEQLVLEFRGASRFEPDFAVEGMIAFREIPVLATLENQSIIWAAFALPTETWFPLDRLDGQYGYEVEITCSEYGGCVTPIGNHACYSYPSL